MKYVHAKGNAGARKESLVQKGADHFEISVREKAERNLANTRVLELIAEHFKILANKVRIINGHHHPSKLIAIDD